MILHDQALEGLRALCDRSIIGNREWRRGSKKLPLL